jgi:NADPH-dependent 2,4-dienoyl-CoA reductase/sulfur reductase-like enzyme
MERYLLLIISVKKSKFIILGGGMVAGYAAKELVERGLKPGELTILSAEDAVPYERPPLSKGLLAGKDKEEDIGISPRQFYDEHGIELVTGHEAAGIDSTKRVVRMRSGEEYGFEKLVVATGASPRTLDIPGNSLQGICYLRSLADSKQIRDRAVKAKHAVVVGSGFIGMEVSSVLTQKSIETTMVLRDDRVWKNFFTPAMSRMFEQYFSSRGVRFVTQAEVKEARGKDSVASVSLSDRSELKCDLLVAGIGVKPETRALDGSDIEVENGVVVNEYLESSAPAILAAGDVANYHDVLFKERRRVEHWDNAVSQGKHCAKVLTGDRVPFTHVPYFFSDVFDLSYEFWGDQSGADEVVERGDMESHSFSVWWLKQGRLAAAFTMARPDQEREAAPRWIESQKPVTSREIKADSWPTA